MKILMVGTGYVGLVTGACFAEIGHRVICFDNNQKKIEQLNQGQIPIFEPGLDDLVAHNKKINKISFIADLDFLDGNTPDFVFLAVGTPSLQETGQADLSYVLAAAEEAARKLAAMPDDDFTVFVTKSTVPVGTSIKVREAISRHLPQERFAVASNPEFLREGAAIEDFMKPSRIVVGSDSEDARRMLEKLYRPLTRQGYPLVVTSTVATAELIKYAANAFLATKITFINELSQLCENVDARIDELSLGLGLDKRIGDKFLQPGPGYGGSCLPKDTRALVNTAADAGSPLTIVETVVLANEIHKQKMVEKIIKIAGGDIKNKRVGILGLAFKAHTDDVREAPALTIIPALAQAGASIIAFDPEGAEQARSANLECVYTEQPEQVFENADLVVLITEWPQFNDLNWPQLAQNMRSATIIDLRNILPHDELREAGFAYHSIGGYGDH